MHHVSFVKQLFSKKFLSTFLTLTLALVMLQACAQSNNSSSSGTTSNQPSTTNETASQSSETILTSLDKPVEITFWHAMTGHHEETLQKIADDFMKQHSNIKINLVSQGGYGDLQQKLTAAAKSKTLPTMSQAYEEWITDDIQNNLVVDLTPYIENATVGWSQDELNDIVEVFRQANNWDGHYYGMPFNKSTRILFYNTDYFKDKNVNVPSTWDELRDAAKALTFDNNGKKVIGMGFENSVGTEFSMWVRQAGGQFIDEQTGTVEFNSPEGKKALTFLQGMFEQGIARLAGEDGYMSNPFGRGDVAMYIGSSAGIPFVAKAAEGNIHWSATVLPKDKKSATPFAGTSVTVYQSATPEQRLAAWEFIKFLINTDNTAFWAKETGYLPVRYSALQSETWKQYVANNPAYGVGEQQFDAGFFEPRILGMSAVYAALGKEIEAALLGQKSVDQALEDAAKAAQEALDRAKQRAR